MDNIRAPQAATRGSATPSTASTNSRVRRRARRPRDVVFHLAAAVGVKLIVESPVRTIETNVHGTEVVLPQANKKKKKVLIASTSEVYGLSTDVPFREDGDLVMGATTKGRWSLRLLQGDRRVPGPGLLAGEEAADGRRPAVQHGRAAADRAVRHGVPDVRPAGAGGPPDHRLRRRDADALLLPRRRRGRRARQADGPPGGGRPGRSTSASTRGGHDRASSPSGSRR